MSHKSRLLSADMSSCTLLAASNYQLSVMRGGMCGEVYCRCVVSGTDQEHRRAAPRTSESGTSPRRDAGLLHDIVDLVAFSC